MSTQLRNQIFDRKRTPEVHRTNFLSKHRWVYAQSVLFYGHQTYQDLEIRKRVFVLLIGLVSIGLTQMYLVFVVDEKTSSLSMLRPRFLSQLHRSVSSVSSTWFNVLSVESLTGITQNWRRDIYSFPSGKTSVTLQANQLVSSEESKSGPHLFTSSFSGQINNEDMSFFSGFQRLATIRMSEFVILALLCLMKCFVKNQLLAQTPRDLRTLLWLDGKLHVELFALWHLLCRRRAVCFNVCKISLYPPS